MIPTALWWILGVAILGSVFLGVWYRVRETCEIASGLSFGSMRIESAIHFRQVCIIWIKVLFLVLLLSLAFIVLVALDAAGNSPLPTFGSTIVGAVLFLGGLGMIMPLVARYELTQHFCETLTITYDEELEDTLQGITDAPKHSEGFADALDVGAL